MVQALLLAAMAAVVTSEANRQNRTRPPNILYLVADDLRPQLGSYGQAYMKTPNLDRLSASGLHFDFAYTNFAYCAPSRGSFLSGRRPDRTRVWNFMHTFREATGGSDWIAMPEFFKEHGYFTSAAGKIYHDGMDDPRSWSYPSNQTKWHRCTQGDIGVDEITPDYMWKNFCGISNKSKIPFADEDLILHEGLRRLELAQDSGMPWFVAVGLHRPHWPFRTPPGFYGYELYPGDIVKAPVHPEAPDGAPFMSGNWAGGDIVDPARGCATCLVPDERSVEYRRWYYAAVTWSDHVLGKVLSRLDEMGETHRTIVVFHSDHGYQLGELNEWSKMTNTELATHIPLLVRVPWKNASLGKRTTVKAELIDLYRTLAELSGFGSDVEDSVQGTSLAALFEAGSPPMSLREKVAFSQIPRCGCGPGHRKNSTECGLGKGVFPGQEGPGACIGTEATSPDFDFMGYSMRTQNWRYTAWVPWDHNQVLAKWPSLDTAGNVELFDLEHDDGRNFDFAGYSKNLAGDPKYRDVTVKLHDELRKAVNSWQVSELYIV